MKDSLITLEVVPPPEDETVEMSLLPDYIRKIIPKLYATENLPFEKKIIHTKFFTPDSDWTWYVAEFDGEDTFFGFVEGHNNEWGYFSLEELQQGRGPWGLGIERDIYWEQKTIGYRLHKFEKCNTQKPYEDEPYEDELKAEREEKEIELRNHMEIMDQQALDARRDGLED